MRGGHPAGLRHAWHLTRSLPHRSLYRIRGEPQAPPWIVHPSPPPVTPRHPDSWATPRHTLYSGIPARLTMRGADSALVEACWRHLLDAELHISVFALGSAVFIPARPLPWWCLFRPAERRLVLHADLSVNAMETAGVPWCCEAD